MVALGGGLGQAVERRADPRVIDHRPVGLNEYSGPLGGVQPADPLRSLDPPLAWKFHALDVEVKFRLPPASRAHVTK